MPVPSRLPYIHHDLLGHVPRPGFRGIGSANSLVTIEADGFRYSGEPPISSASAILAVGDSYTYGEEVGDLESWPAQLQRLIGRRVLNGGVSGYGLDQIVLRAEQLASLHRPPLIIVGFIANDVWRTEMRRLWWRDKPWFAIEADQLVLKGVPVRDKSRLPFQFRHRVERVLIQLPRFLQLVLGYHARAHPVGTGISVVQRLMERLAKVQAKYSTRIVILAQYSPAAWTLGPLATEELRLTRTVLDCATANGLTTLDTFRRFASEPTPQRFYASSHMNARGNMVIASLLAAKLRTLVP